MDHCIADSETWTYKKIKSDKTKYGNKRIIAAMSNEEKNIKTDRWLFWKNTRMNQIISL